MDSESSSSGILEIEGDLFDVPNGAALLHACNAQGSWGSGIARTFKRRYPAAFDIYRSHCQTLLSNPQYKTVPAGQKDEIGTTSNLNSSSTIKLPEGTALIIPPQKSDYEKKSRHSKKHWIICLFTSRGFGRNRSSPEVILANTVLAVRDMKEQLARLKLEVGVGEEGAGPGEIWSCRFNSGLFGVDWEFSKRVLVDEGVKMTVVSPLL